MRKILTVLLLAGLFLMPVSGRAASEDPTPEGQVISRFIGLSYFQVWLHSDGRTWQDTNHDGRADKPGITESWTYTVPWDYLKSKVEANGYSADQITGVRIRYLTSDEWTEDLYNQYRGYRNLPFDDPDPAMVSFKQFILDQSASKGARGSVSAKEFVKGQGYTIHYDGIFLSVSPDAGDMTVARQGAMSLKRSDNRTFVTNTLGIPMNLPAGASFETMTAGYIYWVPYLVEIYGVPDKPALPDFYVTNLNPGTDKTKPGQPYTATFTAGLKSGFSTATPATVTVSHNGTVVPGYPQIIDFEPNVSRIMSFDYIGQSGNSNLAVSIAPVGWDDADWSNNSVNTRVSPATPSSPVGPTNDSLTFQAYSQAGNDVFGNYHQSEPRPAGTAKWTDTVKATLKPGTPVPPKGELDWWKITSASLTYPKQNPDFTFGTPYPPVGTRTVSMNPQGHTATVEFREDWGMDGAQIYSMLENKMMAETPKKYTITAKYTVEYQYTWQEPHTGRRPVYNSKGEITGYETYTYYTTETGQGASSKTVSGQLLVNGTGVNSLAE